MTMDLCSLNKNKYEIWELNEIGEVAYIKFSPCTSRIGTVLSDGKSVRILQVDYTKHDYREIFTYHSDFEIEDIKWSPDSCALLLVSLQDCHFTVLNCLDPELTFRVQEPNTVHLASVNWVPDSKHLISISTFNIFTFAHSSQDGRRILLPSICCADDCKPLLAFSQSGKYAASVTVYNSTYHVNLLSTSSWNVLWNTRCDLRMIQGLEWSLDSSLLAVWNSYKQVSYFGLNGEIIKQLFYDNFKCIGFLQGIFSPNNDLFVATCLQDGEIKILMYNLITWQLCAILKNDIEQRSHVSVSCPSRRGSSPITNTGFSVKNQLCFSCCGDLLAASLSGHIIIWNVAEAFEPCKVLDASTSLAGLQWHPKKAQIAALTSNGTMLLWKYSQGGPIDRKDKLISVDTKSSAASTLLWSKSNLIITPLRGMQSLIVLIKKKRSKKKSNK